MSINLYCLRDYRCELFLESNLQMCINCHKTPTQQYHPGDYVRKNTNGKEIIKIFIAVLLILVKEL